MFSYYKLASNIFLDCLVNVLGFTISYLTYSPTTSKFIKSTIKYQIKFKLTVSFLI